MASYIETWTEEQLQELEREIQALYNTVASELDAKTRTYFKNFEQRFLEQYAAYQAGEYTKEQFESWWYAQVGRGEQWDALKEEAAKMLTETNQGAASTINGRTPGIAMENYNFVAYQVEKSMCVIDAATSTTSGIAFNLANKRTVQGLATSQIDFAKDTAWNSKRIQNALLQGILQGESIGKIADRFQYSDYTGGMSKKFQTVAAMNRTSAIRNARTFVTCAQNYGTQKGFEDATEMGIELKKEWICTHDERTRESHRMLDGYQVEQDKDFPNGLAYPGDSKGKPAERYNCRCTMRGVIPGVNDEERDLYTMDKDGTWVIKKGKKDKDSYENWKAYKESQKKPTTYTDATSRAIND